MRRSQLLRTLIGVLIATTFTATAFGACGKSKSAAKSTPSTAARTGPAQIVFAAAAKTAAARTTKVDVALLYASFPGSTGPVTVHGTGSFDIKAKQGTLHLDLSPLFATLPAAQRQSLPANAGNVDVVFDKSLFFLKAPVLSTVAPTLKPWLKIDMNKADQATNINLTQLQQLGGGNDPGEQLAVLLGTTNATTVGPENVGDEATTHYKADVDLNQAERNAGTVTDPARFKSFVDQLGKKTVSTDVWIDASGKTRRLQLDIASKPSAAVPNPQTFTLTIEYHDFGTSVTVTDPPNDQVTDLIELSKKASTTTATKK